MHNITELVDRYIAVWNEPDDEVRRKHIADLWVEDGGTYHKLIDARGYDAIEARDRRGRLGRRRACDGPTAEGICQHFEGFMAGGKRPAGVDLNQGERLTLIVGMKAGGTGLTLTAANHVLHFDRWWNPAVEAQAIDRAHRIGQTRQVFAYRLIARDTVEEKILTLQNRKRKVIEATIGGEEEFSASLSWDEIQELLA